LCVIARINAIACIAFYTYIVRMSNIKSIVDIERNVKHASTLHIARITDYNDRTNMATQPKPKPIKEAASKKRAPNQQTILSLSEQERLDGLVVRFQRVVTERNARFREKRRADIENPDVVRAGLLALEQLRNDDEFHRLIIEAKDRR
jgi:hypothetical protein